MDPMDPMDDPEKTDKSPECTGYASGGSSDAAVEQHQLAPMSKTKWVFVCIGLYITAFLYGLDTTIAAAIQGPIFVSLGNIEQLPWVGVGFPMGSVCTLLLFGRCYGLFELKWLYIGSFLLFEVGSAVCGAAPNMNAMIVGRVVTGIGGGGMYLGILNYVTRFTSLHERGLYVALIGGVWGLGCILGPVIGGAFAASGATWRWAFYINLVLAVIEAPLFLWRFPNFNPRPDLSTRQKAATLDGVGIVLHAAAFALFMVALSVSGTTFAWSSASAIVLWVFTGITVILYAVQQSLSIFTAPEHRLFPVHFVLSRSHVLLYVGTTCSVTAFFVTTYYIPLFFQFTKNDSPILAAVRLLPFIVVNVVFNMSSGFLLPRLQLYAPFYLAGGLAITAGGALMYTLTPNTSAASIYGYEVLISAGSGFTLQIGYAIAAAKTPPHQVDQSISFQNVSQIGSTSIALAISGCIFQNVGFRRLAAALAGRGYSELDLRTALAGTLSPVLEQGDAMVREIAVAEIVSTIRDVYALIIVAGALMTVVSLAMRWERLQFKEAVAGG